MSYQTWMFEKAVIMSNNRDYDSMQSYTTIMINIITVYISVLSQKRSKHDIYCYS